MDRLEIAEQICQKAGALAMEHYQNLGALEVERKGLHDLVSQADRDVENLIREELNQFFPDDGIVGEEHGHHIGRSGHIWVVDPIDGTANFLAGRPQWCVVLASVKGDATELGVIHDPNMEETYRAGVGVGAELNRKPMKATRARSFKDGEIGIGYSNFATEGATERLVSALLARDANFFRNASGALSLAYVASGRLIGHLEQYHNAWDCLAGQLMITQAGGRVEPHNPHDVIANGTRIVAGSAPLFPELVKIADHAFV